MAQWVNRLRNNIFVNLPPLPLLCEISGALTALPMHSNWFFRIKPIARLIFKARNFRKPYDFVPIPTIKYYRT